MRDIPKEMCQDLLDLHKKKVKELQDAEDYEKTLDTLVEWFGGIGVPYSTYLKLRDGADEVAEWISVNKGNEKPTNS